MAAQPAAPMHRFPPRDQHTPTENQRKRERRRRNRYALHRELEELVLRHTQVRIKPDGELQHESGRVSFRISPDLEGDERYNYLLDQLAPKRKRAQGGNDDAKNGAPTEERPPVILKREERTRRSTPSEASSSSGSSRRPSRSPSPMEGVEVPLPKKGDDVHAQPQADASLAQRAAAPPAPTPTASPRVEQLGEGVAHEEKAPYHGNVAMCTVMAACSRGESRMGWVPPKVTHDFSYPSDEEIIPNPKVNFKKTLLPRPDRFRSWFKGACESSGSNALKTQEAARTSAPCLPITTGKGSLSDGDDVLATDMFPRCYVDITSRLPKDASDLRHMVDRAGASTRLKSIAIQRVMGSAAGGGHEEGDPRDGETASDSESSSSLENHDCLPHYKDFVPSIALDDEERPDVCNSAPAHMAVDDIPEHSRRRNNELPRQPRATSLEE